MSRCRRALSSCRSRITAPPTVPKPAKATRKRGGFLGWVGNAFSLEVGQIELPVDGANRVVEPIPGDDAGDADLGAADELDIDAVPRRGLNHAAGDSRRAAGPAPRKGRRLPQKPPPPSQVSTPRFNPAQDFGG